MADDQPEVEHPKAHSAPEVVAATNRVNVALPFSSIHIEESSRDLAELAVVVADLVTIVEGVAPGPKVKRQRERTQMLATRVRSSGRWYRSELARPSVRLGRALVELLTAHPATMQGSQ